MKKEYQSFDFEFSNSGDTISVYKNSIELNHECYKLSNNKGWETYYDNHQRSEDWRLKTMDFFINNNDLNFSLTDRGEFYLGARGLGHYVLCKKTGNKVAERLHNKCDCDSEYLPNKRQHHLNCYENCYGMIRGIEIKL